MTILSLIPNDLKAFLYQIEGLGARLCLVGGGPRDFLMSQVLSNDLDFEVRGLEISKIKSYLKSKQINFTELPYDITRVEVLGFDVEFSSPRLENPLLDNKSHHHFEAILDKNLAYDRAFSRRDFTLNAIGIEFDFANDTAKIVDPFNGVSDLENKTLREISDYFFLDSVRFLRLVRFHVKCGFKISDSIKNQMGLFDLSDLSLHHFKEEMRKSKAAGPFINAFNDLVKNYQIQVKDIFKIWESYHFSNDIDTPEDLLALVFFKNPLDAKKVSEFFLMPEKKLKDLKSFHESFNVVLKIKKEDLAEIAHKKINDPSILNTLRDLKNLEDKKEWRKYYPNHLIISWDDWENVTVSPEDLQNIEAPLRSYVRFYQTILKVTS